MVECLIVITVTHGLSPAVQFCTWNSQSALIRNPVRINLEADTQNTDTIRCLHRELSEKEKIKC